MSQTDRAIDLSLMSLECRINWIIKNTAFGPVTFGNVIAVLEDAAINLCRVAGISPAGPLIERVNEAKKLFVATCEHVYESHCDAWLVMAHALVDCEACKANGKTTEYRYVETQYGDCGESETRRCDECHGTGRRFFHYDYSGCNDGHDSFLIVSAKRPKLPARANRRIVPNIDIGIDVGAMIGFLAPLQDVRRW